MRKYNRHVPCLIFERRENQAVEFESKEPLNKSSAERVAVKIGMITRRATKVVAWTYDAKERNEVTLQSVTRGTREAGSGSVECHDRGPACSVSASIPLRGRIFLRKTPLLSPRSPPDFAATRMEQGFAGDLLCQAPSEGSQPFASSPFAHLIPQSRCRACGGVVQRFLKEVFRRTLFCSCDNLSHCDNPFSCLSWRRGYRRYRKFLPKVA